MTAQDVQRLNNHWQRHPPLRALVASCAAALGVKLPSPDDKPRYMTTEEAKRFIRITQGRIPGVGGM